MRGGGEFLSAFCDELLKLAFADAFLSELEGIEKHAFLPVLPVLGAIGILGGGATLAGGLGLGKPSMATETAKRHWFSWRRDAPRIFGHFAEVGGLHMGPAAGITTSLTGAALKGGARPSFVFRPPTISGMRLPGAF